MHSCLVRHSVRSRSNMRLPGLCVLQGALEDCEAATLSEPQIILEILAIRAESKYKLSDYKVTLCGIMERDGQIKNRQYGSGVTWSCACRAHERMPRGCSSGIRQTTLRVRCCHTNE